MFNLSMTHPELNEPLVPLRYEFKNGYILNFLSDYTAESPYWFGCSIGFYLMRTVKEFKCRNARLIPEFDWQDGMTYEAGFPVTLANDYGADFKEDEKKAALKWLNENYILRKTYIYYDKRKGDAIITLKPEHGATRHGYLIQDRERCHSAGGAQNFLDNINVFNNERIYIAYLYDENGEEVSRCYRVFYWDVRNVADWVQEDIDAGREPTLPDEDD